MPSCRSMSSSQIGSGCATLAVYEMRTRIGSPVWNTSRSAPSTDVKLIDVRWTGWDSRIGVCGATSLPASLAALSRAALSSAAREADCASSCSLTSAT